MATAVVAFSQLANELEDEGLTAANGERIAAELAKAFSVQVDEVAVLKLEKTNLIFIYPSKLQNVGSIPLNNSSSVAARTAVTKRAETINNFSQTKHASVFESVSLSAKKIDPTDKAASGKVRTIQKLMTVPVVSAAGVQGVIQVCRKGESAPSAGADFTPVDLQKLVAIAASLAKCFK